MATLSRSISVLSNGEVTVNSRPQLWRVLHDVELPPNLREVRWGVPEVYLLDGATQVMPVTKEWQLLIKSMNPSMTNFMWRRLLDWQRAFTNKSAGYDFVPEGDTEPIPLQDWVNLRDLNATGVPRFERARICGGAVVTGVVEGDKLWVSTLDGNAPAPTNPADIPIWNRFVCLNVKDSRTITKFPQGGGADVWMPFVVKGRVSYPLAKLQRWTSDTLPNPYTIYSPISV